MTSRRDFLRRGAIALAGGLIVGDAALEMFERLTHVRKSFPSADVGGIRYSSDIWERLGNGYWSHRTEYPGLPGKWGAVVHHWDQPSPPVVFVGKNFSETPTRITVRSVIPPHIQRIAGV